ncbi:MAG: hypothetical protein ACYC0F_08920 [Rhodanobacter sp.]
MPRRKPAIDDETLRREAGDLADEVLLLPQQVILLTGLSVGQLKERQRTRPPKPPHPEPREKERKALWYSLGAVRRYREWVKEQAEGNAVIAKRQPGGFAGWLNSADLQSEPWPCAIVGPYKRPVDAWATIRGEVSMGRADRIAWLSLPEYLDARQKAAVAQQRAEDRVEAIGTAKKRQERAGTIKEDPTRRVRAES